MSKELAESIIQEWINSNSYLSCFDKEITIDMRETIKVSEIIEMLKRYNQSNLKDIENSVSNCFSLVERALDSYKKGGVTETDWLEGQLHAFNKCLRIINENKL